MDRQKVVNTVLGAVLKKGQEEVSSLIGQPVEFSDSQMLESVREDLFDGMQDLQVLAELKVEGDRQGTAWVMADFRDALTLGGTLIMLPENELEERIEKKAFGEDEADAFGEIINILTGVMSGLFDELFPDKLRFVKTGLELINPLQVAAKEEYPFPEGALRIVAGTGTLQEKPLAGKVQVIVPAVLLGFDEAAASEAPAKADAAAEEGPAEAEPAAAEAADGSPEQSGDAAATEGADVSAETESSSTEEPGQPQAEAVEQQAASAANPNSEVSQQKLEKILTVVHAKIRDEVAGFLGHSFDLKGEEFCKISRDELFSGLTGTHVLAHMKIEGDRSGEGYLLVDLNAAIRLGGTLIMLPDSELDSRLESGEYGAEDSDAFGEIVNIIAGIYTAVFNDLYPGSLRFVKTEQQTLDPLVIDAKGEYPMDEEEFFVARGEALLDDNSLGAFSVCVPVGVLGLKEGAVAGESEATTDAVPQSGGVSGSEETADNEAQPGTTPAEGGAAPTGESAEAGATADGGTPLFFVYGDSEEEVGSFIKALEGINFSAKFKNVQDGGSEELLGPSARGVFLVMGDVGEKGIATAIKIHAAVQDRMPLIAAGPNWTRSMVLRAIKYGIQDILVTPASEAQIQEKVRAHIAN